MEKLEQLLAVREGLIPGLDGGGLEQFKSTCFAQTVACSVVILAAIEPVQRATVAVSDVWYFEAEHVV